MRKLVKLINPEANGLEILTICKRKRLYCVRMGTDTFVLNKLIGGNAYEIYGALSAIILKTHSWETLYYDVYIKPIARCEDKVDAEIIHIHDSSPEDIDMETIGLYCFDCRFNEKLLTNKANKVIYRDCCNLAICKMSEDAFVTCKRFKDGTEELRDGCPSDCPDFLGGDSKS